MLSEKLLVCEKCTIEKSGKKLKGDERDGKTAKGKKRKTTGGRRQADCGCNTMWEPAGSGAQEIEREVWACGRRKRKN